MASEFVWVATASKFVLMFIASTCVCEVVAWPTIAVSITIRFMYLFIPPFPTGNMLSLVLHV